VHVAPAIGDGALYLVIDDGRVVALDAITGRLLWSLTFGLSFDVATPIALAFADGKIFVGSVEGTIFGIDAATGQVLWDVDTNRRPKAAAATGGMVFVSLVDEEERRAHVSALDAETGVEMWRIEVSNRTYAGAPSYADGTVYFIAGDQLHAVDAGTGAERWAANARVGSLNPVSGPVVVANHSLYARDGSGNLVVFDADTGQARWTVSSLLPMTGPPVAVGPDVLVATAYWGGEVRALRLSPN
jgi:outer membrane protein assembly factor BamB